MSTLLLAFANSETKRLKTLADEYTGVTDALHERQAQGDFGVIPRPFATRSQILADIKKWEPNMCLFLFSGHAGRDKLLLEDGVGNSEGLAGLLGHCPNVKVIILNGCSTGGQVDLLLKHKVPIVIATSAPVNDEIATQFSITLFIELSQNRLPIGKAFDRAIEAAQFYGQIPRVDRGSRSLDPGESEKSLWGIYYYPENEALAATWQLPQQGKRQVKNSPNILTKDEIKDLIARNELPKAISKLISFEKVSDKAREQLAALTDLEDREMSNTISFSKASIRRAQIVNTVLKLTDQLE